MKTITVRDLRHKWPEAEKALSLEKELVITRDGRPIAKLTAFHEPKKNRPRFSAAANAKWMKEVYGDKVFPSSSEFLQRLRDEEDLI